MCEYTATNAKFCPCQGIYPTRFSTLHLVVVVVELVVVLDVVAIENGLVYVCKM